MYYNCIEIRPDYHQNRWIVQHQSLNGDRTGKTVPNGLGFYHYPRKMGKRKAFERLKKVMIDHHKKAIIDLQKSLQALETVSL